jgi:hypothetical protein
MHLFICLFYASSAIVVEAAVLDFDLWSDAPEYDVVALLNQSRDAKHSGYGHGHGHGNRYGTRTKITFVFK